MSERVSEGRRRGGGREGGMAGWVHGWVDGRREPVRKGGRGGWRSGGVDCNSCFGERDWWCDELVNGPASDRMNERMRVDEWMSGTFGGVVPNGEAFG